LKRSSSLFASYRITANQLTDSSVILIANKRGTTRVRVVGCTRREFCPHWAGDWVGPRSSLGPGDTRETSRTGNFRKTVNCCCTFRMSGHVDSVHCLKFKTTGKENFQRAALPCVSDSITWAHRKLASAVLVLVPY
jgi:hypothetical protein